MNRSRPTAFVVDRHVQGALLLRTIVYWLLCLLSISLVLLGWDAYHGPSRGFTEVVKNVFVRFGPALSASLLMLPIVVFEVLRVSGRFLRPVLRLRQGLRDVADGRPAQPLNFRDDNFWRELASDFNRVSARISRDTSDRYSPTEEMPQATSDSTV